MRDYTFKSFYLSHRIEIIAIVLGLIASAFSYWFSLLCFLFLLITQARRIAGRGEPYILFVIGIYFFYFVDAYNNPDVSTHNVLWHSVLPVLAFLIGREIGNGVSNERALVYWLFVMMVSLSFNSIPITLYDVFRNGLVNPDRSLKILEGVQRAVTSRALDMAMALAGACCIFFLGTEFRKINEWFVAFSIIGLLCSFHYLSRTGVILFSVSLILGLIFSKKDMKTVLFIIIFVVVLYALSKTSLYTAYAEREIGENSLTEGGGRTVRWQWALEALLQHPHGYSFEDYGFYAHQLWLDMGREGGLVSALLMFIFSVLVLLKTIIISFRNKNLSTYIRCIILTFSIVFFLGAATEPINSGNQGLLWQYLIFCGMMTTSPEKRMVNS